MGFQIKSARNVFIVAALCLKLLPASAYVINGVETNLYPAVGQLDIVNEWKTGTKFGSASGKCTATLIGERVALTSLHCFTLTRRDRMGNEISFLVTNPSFLTPSRHDVPTSIGQFDGGKTTMKFGSEVVLVDQVFYMSRSLISGRITGNLDLALVYLKKNPQGVNPLPIDLTPIQGGDETEIIGFGLNQIDSITSIGKMVGAADGKKRIGSNYIYDFNEGLIRIFGRLFNRMNYYSNSPSGDFATVAAGDSGGPLLRHGGIIGVAYAAGVPRELHGIDAPVVGQNDRRYSSVSMFVQLSQKKVVEFLDYFSQKNEPQFHFELLN